MRQVLRKELGLKIVENEIQNATVEGGDVLWTGMCPTEWFNVTLFRVPTAQGKQGKLKKKIPVRENTGNLENLPKHREKRGNLVC